MSAKNISTTKPKIEIPPLIAEACEYCQCKDHPNPIVRCMAYGGFLPNMWLTMEDVPYQCLQFTRKEVVKVDT